MGSDPFTNLPSGTAGCVACTRRRGRIVTLSFRGLTPAVASGPAERDTVPLTTSAELREQKGSGIALGRGSSHREAPPGARGQDRRRAGGEARRSTRPAPVL